MFILKSHHAFSLEEFLILIIVLLFGVVVVQLLMNLVDFYTKYCGKNVVL